MPSLCFYDTRKLAPAISAPLSWSELSCLVPTAGDDVDDAGRNAGHLDDGGEGEGGERGVLGRLADGGTAGGQGG